VFVDTLYQVLQDAEYLLNIPMMKGHMRAGMTMFAKNHFGSQTRAFASHLHNGLVAPEGWIVVRGGYGLYRVQVDFMTHPLTGGKNLVYILDALWATDYELDKPIKWSMTPFNGDYTSSLFVSFDPVAIESVGYDFLRTEFTVGGAADASVQMEGADDYLHQAADSERWPAGIVYDPGGTGTHIASLGVHEHWNNGTAKAYSRNLGTGNGIELIDIEQSGPNGVGTPPAQPEHLRLHPCYPNPFNGATTIAFHLETRSAVSLQVFDISGREIAVLVSGDLPAGDHTQRWDATGVSSGVYLVRLKAGSVSAATKVVLLR
jgi:hypothetical protein